MAGLHVASGGNTVPVTGVPIGLTGCDSAITYELAGAETFL